MEIKVGNRKGIILQTKDQLCDDNITIKLDNSLFDDSIEDGLVTRTLTYYYNDRVTFFAPRVFQSYDTEIVIEAPNVTSIGLNCFYASKGVTKLILPKLVSVGGNAFYQMTALKVLNLPSVEAIQGSTCRYSSGFEVVYLPKLKKLTPATFADCSNLSTFIIGSDVTMENVSVFVRTPIENGTGYIYVPDETVETYKVATNFSTYATQIKG